MMTKVRIINRWEYDDLAMLVYRTDWEGRRNAVAKPLDFVESAPGAGVAEPTASFDRATAQTMMDDLWACGIRPKEQGAIGALSATERHLKDMQRLVFGAESEPTK